MNDDEGECKGCNPCTRQQQPIITSTTPTPTPSNNTVTKITPIMKKVMPALDAIDIFDAIRDIRDPERPNTLEELNVIDENLIDVLHLNLEESNQSTFGAIELAPTEIFVITIWITPTVKHCSLVADISLCIRMRLHQVFGDVMLQNYKIDIRLTEGSHDQEASVNRQINDKERVAAAMENPVLMQLIHSCVQSAYDTH